MTTTYKELSSRLGLPYFYLILVSELGISPVQIGRFWSNKRLYPHFKACRFRWDHDLLPTFRLRVPKWPPKSALCTRRSQARRFFILQHKDPNTCIDTNPPAKYESPSSLWSIYTLPLSFVPIDLYRKSGKSGKLWTGSIAPKPKLCYIHWVKVRMWADYYVSSTQIS